MEKLSSVELEFANAIQGAKRDLVKEAEAELYGSKEVPSTLANLFTRKDIKINSDIHPVALKDVLVDTFAVDWLDWYPETIEKTVLDGKPNPELLNKIMALQTCLKTDTPWREWHIFENVGKAFNHQLPNFGILQPLTLGECLTTLDTLNRLRPGEKLQEEVKIYIAAVATEEQYIYIPQELSASVAQPYLDKMINGYGMKDQIRSTWDRIKGKSLLDVEFKDDDLVERQLANLTVLKQYKEEYDAEYGQTKAR